MSDDEDERVQAALSIAQDAMQRVATLEDDYESEIAELRDELDRLREENEELRERTELLSTVRQNANPKPDDRAAILVQALVNEAVTNGRTGRHKRASSDAASAVKTLGGGARRDAMYRTFERAEDLVDRPDVVYYKKESRSSKKNSRLVVDLENGDVPAVVAGHRITTPPEVGGED